MSQVLRQQAGLRWVACSKKRFGHVGAERHLLPVGKDQVTTLCNATGLGGVWRGNTTKPKCKRCAEIEPKNLVRIVR